MDQVYTGKTTRGLLFWALIGLFGTPQASATAVQLPLSFEANLGQVDESIDFVFRHGAYDLALHPGGATAHLEPLESGAPPAILRWEIVGMDHSVRGSGEGALQSVSHYLQGPEKSDWATRVPHYRQVRYAAAYPGIDLVFYESMRMLEYDFVVEPGVDPSIIAVRFHGADRLEVLEDGALAITTPAGTVTQPAPFAYQGSKDQIVPVSYRLLADNTVRFDIGRYDASRALTIDPPLAYSTFLGGTRSDYAEDLYVDSDGNAYVVGWTDSLDFPVTSGAYQQSLVGAGQNAFVAKVSPDGSTLLWSTYIGANTGLRGFGISVDSIGQAAIIGAAGPQSDLWTSDNAVQDSVGNGEHVFVALLADDGSDLGYSTFLSGFNGTGPGGIDVGQNDELFVTGRANTASFPIVNGYQSGQAGGTEVFIARLDPDAPVGTSSLRYSSYLGGSNTDTGDSIAAASDGTAVITGMTQSTNVNLTLFPVKNAEQSTGVGRAAFVARFDTNATGEDSLLFSTFLDGNREENPGAGDGGIALDALGNIYVGGTTTSTDFPTTPGAFKETKSDITDAFVVKYDATGHLVWGTLLGGSFIDTVKDLSVDFQSRVGVTGTTESSDFPMVDPFQAQRTNSTDAFLAVFTPDGARLDFSSFLGGGAGLAEDPTGIAFDGAGNLYTAGAAQAGGFEAFPTTPGSLQPANAGGVDAYLAKVGGEWTQYEDPTFADLEQLREDSDSDVHVNFGGSFPRALRFDLPASSPDPIAAARALVETYPGLFQQIMPAGGRDPESVALSELQVASVYQEFDSNVVTFYQTLGGLPVFGSRLAVLVDDNDGMPMVRMSMGSLLPPVPLNTQPDYTPEEAAEAARSFLGRPGARVSDTRLMVFDRSINRGGRDSTLVWAVTVVDGGLNQVLVDAHSNLAVFSHAMEFEQAIDFNQLDLWDGNNILQWSDTWLSGYGCVTFALDLAGDESGVGPGYPANSEAHWQRRHYLDSLDFYRESFGRLSYDNVGGLVNTMFNSTTNNAAYTPGCGFQSAQGWVSFDIAVHELTHAVIDYTSNLIYQFKSGALNESYSDVMGVLADDFDWLLAEDRTSGLGAIRNLADPLNGVCGSGTCGQPDKMSLLCTDDSQCNFTGDNGAVHFNSGIPNKAHYLMSEGGNFNGINVGNGIGRVKMGWVAYSTMRYLQPWSDFQDARDSSVFWATFFQQQNQYGFTAADVCVVQNAWAAVEVGIGDQDCDGVADDAEDSDNDGILDSADNCPFTPNPLQFDFDGDQIGDLCDTDTDSDGDFCPDQVDTCPGFFSPCPGGSVADLDNDGIGDPCDGDVDGDGISNGPDNCDFDPNPDQLDGNMDGNGDACDPDHDGDGVYFADDNCPFVDNADQVDTDMDGLGDACDTCPDTPDNPNAYTPGYPRLGLPPEPAKPDSDNDGIPDACDPVAFDNVSLGFGGRNYNPALDILAPGTELPTATIVSGFGNDDHDNIIQIQLDACGDGDGDVPSPGQRIQLFAENLPPEIEVSVSDQRGARIAVMNQTDRPGSMPGSMGRGLWFKPDCSRSYTVNLRLPAGFDPNPNKGMPTVQFNLSAELVAGGDLPWTDPDAGFEPPDPIPDFDGDSQPDSLDNCPVDANADQLDTDFDGIGDVCDPCNGIEPVPGLGDGVDCGVIFGNGFEE